MLEAHAIYKVEYRVYYTIPIGFRLFLHFFGIAFQLFETLLFD